MANISKGSIVTGIDGYRYVVTKTGGNGSFYQVKSLIGGKLSKGTIYETESSMRQMYKNTGKKYKGSSGKKTSGSSGG